MTPEQSELTAEASRPKDEFCLVESSSSLGEKKRAVIVALLRCRPERPVLDLREEEKEIRKSLCSLRRDASIRGNAKLIVRPICYEDLLDTARSELQSAISEGDDREAFFWNRLVRVLDHEDSRPSRRKNSVTSFPANRLSGSA